MTSAIQAMTTMENFINSLNQSVKTAETANTEPGSIGGETAHPSKGVDDNTEVAQTGERAAENEKDVKEDQGAASVNSRPDAKSAMLRLFKRAEGSAAATPGSAADDQVQIGTNKQPTGEDPSVETSSVKGGKKDPGTTHPARTDNDNLSGGKYAADMPRQQIARELQKVAETICNYMNDNLDTMQHKTAQVQQHSQQVGSHDLSYSLGGELAAILNGSMNKQAADAMVQRTLQQVIKRASDDAENYAMFCYSLEEQQKIANDAMLPVDQMAGGSDAGGGLPMGDAGGGLPMGGEEEAMLAALGGGEHAEPDGDEGGEGGEIPPEALQQLIEQLGISDDDIEEGTAEELAEGGGEGGAPVDELPPAIPADAAKMGSDKGKKPRSGKTAKDNSTETLRELIERSRNAR